MWVLLYRDGSTRKYATLGLYSKMSKSQAEEKRDELISEVNARNAISARPPHHLRGISRRHRPSLSAVEVEAVDRRDHGKPHQHHLGRSSARRRLSDLGPEGTAIVPERQGGRRSPAASWRICAGICGRSSGWRSRKAIPTATRRRRSLRRRRQPHPPNPSMNKEEVEHIHQRTGTTRARYRASRDLRRHAARRDSGLAAPPCQRRLHEGSASSSASTAATSTRRRRTTPPAPSPFPQRRPSSFKEWMELVDDSPKAWVFASENPATADVEG